MGPLQTIARRFSVLLLLGLALAPLGASAEESAPPRPATNTNERIAGVEFTAPVRVPEPSEKAVRFYRSGIVWWLVGEGWSWLLPALVLFTGFSGWLGRQSKRISRWEVPAALVFVRLYLRRNSEAESGLCYLGCNESRGCWRGCRGIDG